MSENQLRIVSHFPGRLRVRSPRFRDAALADEVVAQLRDTGGVRAATATPFTGSVLVEYDAHEVQLPWLVQLVVKLGGLDGIAVDRDGKPIRPHGPVIKQALERWNSAMLDATRGKLDAKSVVPGTLAALGVYALLFGRRRLPEWYDLLFWSFTSFVNLNPPSASSASSASPASPPPEHGEAS